MGGYLFVVVFRRCNKAHVQYEFIVECQSVRSSVGPRGLIYFRDDEVCRPEIQEARLVSC